MFREFPGEAARVSGQSGKGKRGRRVFSGERLKEAREALAERHCPKKFVNMRH